MPAPRDPEARRRRRLALKALHPDAGGDTDAFVQAVRDLGVGAPPADDLRFRSTPRGVGRLTSWWGDRRRRRHRSPRVL